MKNLSHDVPKLRTIRQSKIAKGPVVKKPFISFVLDTGKNVPSLRITNVTQLDSDKIDSSFPFSQVPTYFLF